MQNLWWAGCLGSHTKSSVCVQERKPGRCIALSLIWLSTYYRGVFTSRHSTGDLFWFRTQAYRRRYARKFQINERWSAKWSLGGDPVRVAKAVSGDLDSNLLLCIICTGFDRGPTNEIYVKWFVSVGDGRPLECKCRFVDTHAVQLNFSHLSTISVVLLNRRPAAGLVYVNPPKSLTITILPTLKHFTIGQTLETKNNFLRQSFPVSGNKLQCSAKNHCGSKNWGTFNQDICRTFSITTESSDPSRTKYDLLKSCFTAHADLSNMTCSKVLQGFPRFEP